MPSLIGGAGSIPGGVAGSVGVGMPVYTNPSGSFTASVGASTSFAPGRYNAPMNPGIGLGMRFKF